MLTQQELNGTKIAGPSVDQGRLRASPRVRAEECRIEADASDPLREQAGVLPCRQAPVLTSAANEQEVARILAAGREASVDRLPRLLGDLELDWPAGLSLPHLRGDRPSESGRLGLVESVPVRQGVVSNHRDPV